MAELKKLKDDQRRIDTELLELKLQNMKLSSQLDNTTNHLNGHGYIPVRMGGNQKAMVVFDLTKNPAIVLTANDLFCKRLGYDMVTISKKQ
jgi:hypothetical protein